MKVTTTLMDIVQSEMINRGYSEFVNDNQLTFFDKDHTFIHKLMRMDRDIKPIIDDMFFQNLTLNTHTSDVSFKQLFMNRFLNRQIAFQTVEAFSSQVVYVFLTHFDFLNYIYDELDDFIKNKTTNDGENTETSVNDFRQLMATLPQNSVNMSLDNEYVRYADENTANKNRNTRKGNTKNEQKVASLDNLLKMRNLLDEILKDFDKKCFLQTW